MSGDSKLLDIGNNTVISTNVEFVLHDFSISIFVLGLLIRVLLVM